MFLSQLQEIDFMVNTKVPFYHKTQNSYIQINFPSLVLNEGRQNVCVLELLATERM